MVNLKDFFPRLIPHVLGCPEPLAQQALLDAAIAFCDQSLVVTTTLDPITVPVGIANVELDTPTSTTVSQVLNCWFDHQLLHAAPYAQATGLYLPDGAPREYFGERVDEVFNLHLLPAPDKVVRNGLVVRVALRPTRTATQVHDILFDRFADAIVYGAAARLMAISDQPFTDDAKSLAYERMARSRAVAARADMLQGQVQSSMRVTMRAF